MKVRAGFVSNSSASSFCIYGTEVDWDDKNMLIKKITGKTREELEDAGEETYFSEIIYEPIKKLGLECWSMCGESHYSGRSFDTIKDDETGKQFKESTQKVLNELFGYEVKCDNHQEAWQEG